MLTQVEAETRAKVVKAGIEYQVYFHVQKEGAEFEGLVEAKFKMQKVESTFMDFGGEIIKALRVNGTNLSSQEIEKAFKEGKLHLDGGLLKEGDNEVLAEFKCRYSRDGNGLQAFRDTDGGFYAFVQTVPYYCNRIFPVFDQPDLKGRRVLYLNSLGKYRKISNTCMESQAEGSAFEAKTEFEKEFRSRFDGQFKTENSISKFEKTSLLASYLFAFMVGDFVEIVNEVEGSVPMSLFMRGPLAAAARRQKSELFEFVEKGIDFYEEFFQTKYPFGKFDFVFCPEFTWTGMEYPGAIVFNDRLIFREEGSMRQISERGNTILHELSHMWFGNLVTMRWWNDLWLNESFADFVSYLAMDHIRSKLPFTVGDPMTAFCCNKARGYAEDQEVTTHPIAGQVADTQQADSVFDGITYSKGAAVIKQLYKLLGHKGISESLGRYFAKFSWRNATLADLLAEFQPASPELDLLEWNKLWIESAGLNCLQIIWTPGETSAKIIQTPAMQMHPTLRPHALSFALFHPDESFEVADLRVEGPETKLTLPAGTFSAILPNNGDWAFAKIELDTFSHLFLTTHFERLDGLQATLLLQSLYEAVRDVRLPATEFVELSASRIFPRPGRASELQTLLTILQTVFAFLPRAAALATADRFFELFVNRLETEKDPDVIKALKAAQSKFAMAPSSIHRFGQMVASPPAQRQFSEEETWRALFLLKGAGDKDQTLVDQVEARAKSLPPSDASRNFTYAIQALSQNPEETSKLLDKLLDPNSTFSFVEMNFIVSGLVFFLKDPEILRPIREKSLLALPKLAATVNRNVFSALIGLVLDTWNPLQTLEHLNKILESEKSMKDSSILILKKNIALFERYARAQLP